MCVIGEEERGKYRLGIFHASTWYMIYMITLSLFTWTYLTAYITHHQPQHHHLSPTAITIPRYSTWLSPSIYTPPQPKKKKLVKLSPKEAATECNNWRKKRKKKNQQQQTINFPILEALSARTQAVGSLCHKLGSCTARGVWSEGGGVWCGYTLLYICMRVVCVCVCVCVSI